MITFKKLILLLLLLSAGLVAQVTYSVIIPANPPGGVGGACSSTAIAYLQPVTGGNRIVTCDPSSHLWVVGGGGSGSNCPQGSAGDVQYYIDPTHCGGATAFIWDQADLLAKIGGSPITPFPGLYVGPDESTLDPYIQGWWGPSKVGIVGKNLSFAGSDVPEQGLAISAEYTAATPGSGTADALGVVSLVHELAGNAMEVDSLVDTGTVGGTARGLVFEIGAIAGTNKADNLDGILISFFLDGGSPTATQGYGLHIGSAIGIVDNFSGIIIDDQATNNWAIKTGLGLVEHDDVMYLAGNVVNPFQQVKNTQSATAPGATKCDLRWIAGTTGSSGKIVAACGTSATEVTIADNVGSGF